MFNQFVIALLLLVTASANAANPAYPLKLKTGARYLVDQNNTPFFIQGDAPWELMQNLNGSDTQQYITNRANKGYNTILCEAIEHQFSTHPPTNAYGQPPFLTKVDATHWNFASTNELYWTNVDAVIRLAGGNGIQVMFFPAYLGFGGGNEGWYADMQANTLATLTNYGKFIANRYMNYTNLIYVMGGDYVAADMTIPDAVAYGILSIDSNHLMTAHSSRNISAVGGYNRPWLNFNSTYGGYFTYTNASNCYTNSSTPSFLIEEYYENESINNLPSTPTCTGQQLRNQEWWAVTSGNMGFIMGNNPLWFLNDGSVGWQVQMDSIGSRTSTNIYQMLRTRPWWNFVPDTNNTILTAGFGTRGDTNWVSCCRDTNAETVICYIPQGPVHTLTIDMTKLNRWYSHAWWYNPSNMVPTYVGVYTNAGTRQFTQPDANDWVLVLDSTTPGFTAPGDLTLIPTNRMIPWHTNITVGVVGGIPNFRTNLIDVTQAPYNADNTGVSDTKSAIQSAIAASASNDVIYLPAGKYLLSSGGLTIKNDHNGITMRGVMSNGTNASLMINLSSQPCVSVGVDPIQTIQASIFQFLPSSMKGSTSVILATNKDQFNQSPPAAPWGATIYQANSGNGWGDDYMPMVNIQGFNGISKQKLWVSAVGGGATPTLTISHPLTWDFTNANTYVLVDYVGGSSLGPVQRIGIENLGFFGTNNAGSSGTATYQVKMEGGKDCWFTGNEIYWDHNYGLFWQYMVGGEVSSNVIHKQDVALNNSNHSGLLVANDTGLLIQNNIIYEVFPGIEFNDGFSGNAIFANFLTNCTTEILCHNAVIGMNLWEQNKAKSYEEDGYFGTHALNTLFRNRLFGTTAIKRHGAFDNFVGNVMVNTNTSYIWTTETSGYTFNPSPAVELGFPNIGNNTYVGTTPPLSFDFPGTTYSDFAGLTRTNGSVTFTNTQIATNYFVGPSPFTNYPASYDSNGTHVVDYVMAFQDASDTNRYWKWADFTAPYDGKTLEITNNPGQPLVYAINGTPTNFVTQFNFTISNGWTMYSINQNGYQQLQATNKYTHIFAQNLVYTNTVGALIQDQLIANTYLQPSLLYSNGAPTWWQVSGTNAPFPAIGPDLAVPSGIIPAEGRFFAAPVSDPNITVQPQNSSVTAPATATFTVTATGTAPVTYQWSKNGTPIGGATLSTYTTPATSYPANNGDTYYVVVTSGVGSLQSSTATLTVNSDITINTQPQPQSVSVGATATFTVSATSASSLTLSYAWTFNGVSVGGNSSSYARSNCQLADSGLQAQVTITDSAGSIVSSAATLTVTGISPPVNLGVSLGSGTHRFGNGTQNIGTK